MTDYSETIQSAFGDARTNARMGVVGSMDADPEQAARSIDLSQATGVPSSTIYGDVDNFERQHKAQLGGEIVNNNAYIADYLNSHPMAPRLSHDDLGQLDTASQSIQGIGVESHLAKWLKDDSI